MKSTAKVVFRALPEVIQESIAGAYVKLKKRRIRNLATPGNLIFFVTNRCNARCAHCFYWQELNTKGDELGLGEIAKIAASLEHPINLSLTGGEPFIRSDLKDICRIFHERNRCRHIGIATNGLTTEKIVSGCREILRRIPLETLSVQVSLDGLAATHNAIRGVENGFKRTMMTVAELSQLAVQERRFSLTVSITVQKRNIDEILPTIDHLVPYGIPIKFALVRGTNYGTYHLPADAVSAVDPKEVDAAIADLDALGRLFTQITKKSEQGPYPFWSPRQREKIRLSLKMMKEKRRQVPCYAGSIDGVMYANGDVALCELTRPVGNLKDYNYDFGRLWQSTAGEEMRKKIRGCFCIHGCNLTTSMMFDPKIVASVLRKP